MKSRLYTASTLSAIAFMLIIGIYTVIQVGASTMIPIHFDMYGQPNSYAPSLEIAIPPFKVTHLTVKPIMNVRPCAISAEPFEIIIDGTFGRKVLGYQRPLAAALKQIKHSVDNCTQVCVAFTSPCRLAGHQRSNE